MPVPSRGPHPTRRIPAFLAALLLLPTSVSIAEDARRVPAASPLLRLPSGTWDPLGPAKPPGAGLLTEPLTAVGVDGRRDDGGHRLAQARRSARELRHDLLAIQGVELLGRIHDEAWAVRVPPEVEPEVAALGSLRWLGPLPPVSKLSERLVRVLGGAELPAAAREEALVRLRVTLHRGEDLAPWADALDGIPAVHVAHALGSTLSLRAPADALAEVVAELVRRHGVAGVELDEVPVHHVDHSNWALQTGIPDLSLDSYDTTARLFALGINGAGLLAVLPEEGLENDDCSFLEAESIADAAWQVTDLTATGPPLEGGTLSAARTRLRKVTGYYLMPGADAYSSDVYHGSRVASVLVGDVGDHSDLAGALASHPLVRDLGTGQNLVSCERPGGDWSPGDRLRVGDPGVVVDDPSVDDPGLSNSYGTFVEHHDPGDGVAPGAQLALFDIGDSTGSLSGFLEAETALDWTSALGGTAYSASFGGGACTDCYLSTPVGADAGLFRHRLIVATSSAGNDGLDGIGTIGSGYAQAKSVIPVGATERANAASAVTPRPGEDVANYSARGPATGQRLAPELVAPGSVRMRAPATVSPEDGTGSGDFACADIGFGAGTSFSNPTIAGASLLVQQYFLDGWYPSGLSEPTDALRPTNALVRAVLVNSTRDLQGEGTADLYPLVGHRPSFGQGWGRPVLDDTLYFDGDPRRGLDPHGEHERAGFVVLSDTPNGVSDLSLLTPEPGGRARLDLIPTLQPTVPDTGIQEWAVEVQNPLPGDPAFDLRITLAWSDAAGAFASPSPLVNDLDLEVVSPSGVVYRPRPPENWVGGFTVPAIEQEEQVYAPFIGFTDYPGKDWFNTVENVFLPSAEVEEGTWRVRVIGYDVGGNGGVDLPATPNFLAGDGPLDRDLSVPCDGVPDIDSIDLIDSDEQGFALVVSGGVGRDSFPCADLRLPPSLVVTPSSSACGLDLDWPAALGARSPVTYEVYRSDSLPVPLDAAHLVASGLADTHWTDEATDGLSWSYRVVATDSCAVPGPRSVPNEDGDSPLTAVPDPSFPGPVEVEVADDACGLLVSWSPAIAAGPVRYDVYRALASPVPLDAAHRVATVFGETSVLDPAPTGALWRYRVVAEESCADPVADRVPNEGGDSAPAGLPRLTFPGPLSATPESCGVLLEWGTALGHGPVVYDVHRGDAPSLALDATTLVASDLDGTSWLDEGWHGPARHYRVVARDLCDDAANTGGPAGPVAPVDVTPPSFAGIVNTRDLGYCEVEVSWDESTAIDDCSGISGYDIYRDHGVGHRGETLIASGVPSSPYVDTTPGNGTWVYVVRAVDGAGNSEDNEVFQQESENSCTNDFPADAGLDQEDNVDPPNADGGNGIAPLPPGGSDLERRLEARIERALGGWRGNGNMRIAWKPSPDEGGLYPVTYSVLRGELFGLRDSGYSHALATPDSCGLVEHEHELPEQVDGLSYYYLVVPVSGDNATFGYDSDARERPAAAVCE